MNTIVRTCPAKINLFLKVVGKRRDGYHDLQTLMCRVRLCDTLHLTFHTPTLSTSCDHPDVPNGPSNLAHRAAALFFKTLSRTEGADIFIEKKIPVAAGLGGGSSNAAEVLMALNAHYGHPLSQNALMDLGLQIGADVPFFILQHTAVAEGLGEKLVPCPNMFPFWVVLVHPRIAVSTAWAYEHLNLGLTNCPETYNVSWFLEDLSRVKGFLCNDLEKVTVEAFPVISTIKGALLDQGADGALMSGSGPTVFGLFSTYEAARSALRSIERRGDGDTFLVDVLVP